ncbi:MAG: hypothetical protein BHV87_06605 [Clostridiales bacterium 36_14]|nr:MAG: hypothetical protein BHV87_06605 [Clostridiales bacterium 36_14]
MLNQQNLNHDGIYSCTGIYFFKSAKFKYNGIELEGYSADEIEKILTVIAQKNDLLKGNSKKGNV